MKTRKKQIIIRDNFDQIGKAQFTKLALDALEVYRNSKRKEMT